MNNEGVRFKLISEGEIISEDWYSDDSVHTIILYDPKLDSLKLIKKIPDTLEERMLVSPVDFIERLTFSQMWNVTIIYKGQVNTTEVPVEVKYNGERNEN